MATLAHTFSDSVTMLRRDFKHSIRYPMMTISSIAVPVVMMLMFVYVFGGAISDAGRGAYLEYVVPGILVMSVGAGTAATAVGISMDMHEGIIIRFRTMAIARVSVLTGQVIGATLRTLITLALIVGMSLALGFRPNATPAEWLAATGVLALLILGCTWLSVALGLLARTPGGANTATMPLQFLLPFLSSTFVPPETMPAGLRWFAENQPFTHVITTLRGLLEGTPIGNAGALSVVWCLGMALAGYLWARRLYDQAPNR